MAPFQPLDAPVEPPMMSPAEFSKEMLSELRKEPLFRYYWSATLDSLVPEAVAYEFVPTETLSYFRRVFETDLFPVANRAPFAGTSCRFMLSLTAACGGSPITSAPARSPFTRPSIRTTRNRAT